MYFLQTRQLHLTYLLQAVVPDIQMFKLDKILAIVQLLELGGPLVQVHSLGCVVAVIIRRWGHKTSRPIERRLRPRPRNRGIKFVPANRQVVDLRVADPDLPDSADIFDAHLGPHFGRQSQPPEWGQDNGDVQDWFDNFGVVVDVVVVDAKTRHVRRVTANDWK